MVIGSQEHVAILRRGGGRRLWAESDFSYDAFCKAKERADVGPPQDAFLSIVAHRDDPGFLLVRARRQAPGAR